MSTRDELRKAIEQHENPFVTSSKIAEVLGVRRQTAWEYLQDMHEDGELEKEKIGGSAVIWWLPEDRR